MRHTVIRNPAIRDTDLEVSGHSLEAEKAVCCPGSPKEQKMGTRKPEADFFGSRLDQFARKQ